MLQVSEARVPPPLASASPASPGRAEIHTCGHLHVSHKLGVLPVCKHIPRSQETHGTNQSPNLP